MLKKRACAVFFYRTLTHLLQPRSVSLPNPNPDSRSRPSYVIVIIS